MTNRDRLIATLCGTSTDRVPVNFYEIGGFDVDPGNPDAFNIYNSPDWQPLLQLAETHTDLIRMREPPARRCHQSLWEEYFTVNTWQEGDSRFVQTTLRVDGRTMTGLTRRDAGIDTVWTLKHLLEDVGDLQAYLKLPAAIFEEEVDVTGLMAEEKALGDRGLVMVDSIDPLGFCYSLFTMENYLVIAMQEPSLFHALLDKLAPAIYRKTEETAKALPGRLWRICGAEVATEPFLPPALFKEYAVRYAEPMVRAIHKYGGWVRLHCHGRIRSALPHIVDMGVDAIDPIEPPHQGDVTLEYVRREYGAHLALFGNLEIADIETMPPDRFERVVRRSLDEGTSCPGRGFCLMPSASPYGRSISATTLANYETMIRLTHS